MVEHAKEIQAARQVKLKKFLRFYPAHPTPLRLRKASLI